MQFERRLNYLDVAKGIGIILVILGHVDISNNPLCNWIYSFHLPLFFIVSGMLLSYKKDWINLNFTKNMKKKAKQLLYPYFTFSALIALCSLINKLLLHSPLFGDVKQILLYTICFEGFSTLWFLPALFIAEMLVINLAHLKHNMIVLFGLILIGVVGSYILSSNILLGNYFYMRLFKRFFNITIRSIIAASFVEIGYLIFPYIHKNVKRANKFFILITCVILFVTNIFTSQFNNFVDLHNSILHNVFLYYMNAIFGSVSILILLKKINYSNSFLEYCGKNSLTIMVTHLPLPILMSVKKIYPFTSVLNPYFNNVLICIMVLIIEIFIVIFINRYMSFLIRPKRAMRSE